MRDVDLTRFLIQARAFPMLEAQEEMDLARRWREGDAQAAHRLINSHLRLVAKIVIGYRGYGLPVNDLLAEGSIGMMQAAARFDPDKGFRLATYAQLWIRAAVQDYVLRNWSLVKIGSTDAQKKLFFRLARVKREINARDDGDLTDEQVTAIAEKLDVPAEEVITMNRRLASADHSLNASITEEGEEWQDHLIDPAPCSESRMIEASELVHHRKRLAEALATLDARERDILTARRLVENPVPFEVLCQRHGLSRQRVYQIETRAIEKLRKAFRKA